MNMKQLCAKEALKYINDGMCVGLGGGSTVAGFTGAIVTCVLYMAGII